MSMGKFKGYVRNVVVMDFVNMINIVQTVAYVVRICFVNMIFDLLSVGFVPIVVMETLRCTVVSVQMVDSIFVPHVPGSVPSEFNNKASSVTSVE